MLGGGVALADETTTASNGLDASELCKIQTEAQGTDYPKPPELIDRACRFALETQSEWSYNKADDFGPTDTGTVTTSHSADKISLNMVGENKGIYISPGNDQVRNVQRDAGIIETSLNITKNDGEIGIALALTDTANITELRNDGTSWKLVGKNAGASFSHNLTVENPDNNKIPTGKVQYRIEYRVINTTTDFSNKRKGLTFLTLKKRSSDDAPWEKIGELKAAPETDNTNIKPGKLGLYLKANTANGLQVDIEKLNYQSYTLEKRAELEKVITGWDESEVNAAQKDNVIRYINSNTGESVVVFLDPLATRTIPSIKSAQEKINTYSAMPSEVKAKLQAVLDTHGIGLSTLTYQGNQIEASYQKANKTLANDTTIREPEGAYTLSPEPEQNEYSQALTQLKEKLSALTAVNPAADSSVDVSKSIQPYLTAYAAVNDSVKTVNLIANKLEINKLATLSDEEKANFKQKITDAGTSARDLDKLQTELEKILQEAKTKAEENLANLKTKAIEEIEKLSDLTSEQINAYKQQINAPEVKTEDDINAIVTKAKALAEKMKALRDEVAKKTTVTASDNKQYQDASKETKDAYDQALAQAEALIASSDTTDAGTVETALKTLTDAIAKLDGEKQAKIKEATAAVEAAEAEPTSEEKYTQAENLVKALEAGEAKTALEKRLEKLKAETEAEKAVKAAEADPDNQELFSQAEAKVKALAEGETRSGLEMRLAKLKAAGAEKAAAQAIEKALADPSASNIAAAETAIEAVADPQKQKEFTTNLAPAKANAQAEANALEKAKAAQKNPTAELVEAAEAAYQQLTNEKSKERVKPELDQALLAGAKQAIADTKAALDDLVAAKTKDSSLFQTRADQAKAAIAKLAAEAQTDLLAELNELNTLGEATKKVLAAEGNLKDTALFEEAKHSVEALSDSPAKTKLSARLALAEAKTAALAKIAELKALSSAQNTQLEAAILAADSLEAVEQVVTKAVALDQALSDLQGQILAAEKEQAKTTYPEFTAPSRAALAKALDQAKSLLAKAELNVEEVETATKALQQAIASLEVVKDKNNGEGTVPEDSDNSGNAAPKAPGVKDNQNNLPVVKVAAQLEQMPNTGVNLWFLLAVGITLVAGGVLVRKRHRL